MKLVKIIVLSTIVLLLSACSTEVDNSLEFEFIEHNYSVDIGTIVFDIDLASLQVDSVYVNVINDEIILDSIHMPDKRIIVDLDGAIIINEIKNIIGSLNGATACSDIYCSPLGGITQFIIVLSDSDTTFDIKFSEYSEEVIVQSIESDDSFFFNFKRGDANEFDEIINSILNEYNK